MSMAMMPTSALLTGMHVRPVDDQLAQLLDVPGRHRHAIRQLLGEHLGQADLVDVDVGIGRDDRARGEVHALAHHVHAEQALLPLDQLLEAPANLNNQT
jgi:hypothetical protein